MNELDTVPFDFVMSIGPACRPAQQIKEAGLRFTAAPMDWMELYPLSAVTHLFATGFSDFFTDIRDETPDLSQKNRRVVDVKNMITSIHHFPTKKSLPAGQKEMRRTMLKRYHRIDKILNRSEAVCLVGNREDTSDALMTFLSDFRNLYPQIRLTMVNIRDVNDSTYDVNKVTQDSITLYEVCFHDVHPDGANIKDNPLAWHGNTPMWQQTLAHIHLRPGAAKVGRSMRKRLFGR